MARHRVDEPWLFNINERLQYKRHSSIYGIVFLFKCFIENCIHSVSMYMLAIQIKLEINACLDTVLICLGYMIESNCIQSYNRISNDACDCSMICSMRTFIRSVLIEHRHHHVWNGYANQTERNGRSGFTIILVFTIKRAFPVWNDVKRSCKSYSILALFLITLPFNVGNHNHLLIV